MTEPIQAVLNHARMVIGGFKLRSQGEKIARQNLIDEINALTAAEAVGAPADSRPMPLATGLAGHASRATGKSPADKSTGLAGEREALRTTRGLDHETDRDEINRTPTCHEANHLFRRRSRNSVIAQSQTAL